MGNWWTKPKEVDRLTSGVSNRPSGTIRVKSLPSVSGTEVHRKIINKIAEDIGESDWKKPGRELDLHPNYLDELEKEQNIKNSGREEKIIRMVEKWMQEKNPEKQMVGHLSAALRSVKRKDIADSICQIVGAWNEEQQTRIYETLEKIEKWQRKVYEKVQLPQVPWTEKILPLEELYVDLEMFKTNEDHEESEGQPITVEELFDQIEGEDPVRILVEGGPGFGKTTLCLKLLNDWGRNREFMAKKFKMIFLLELRNVKESDTLVELLMGECETAGVGGEEGFYCIESFESETLLILDGFDELSDEGKKKFLPLLQKKVFPSMFVVVTSRRGMFLVDKKGKMDLSGYLKKNEHDMTNVQFWKKRILIKGVTRDKIEVFMKKYLEKDFEEFETEITSVTKGEMKEVLQCPLFLILLSMMLEEKTLDKINSETSLYKEFFNFITRRNLIREKKIKLEDEIDLNLIRNMEGIKWLLCRLNCFNSLVDMKWSGLEEIEELHLSSIEDELLPMNPGLFSHLTNLQVLSLDVGLIKSLPRDSRDSFVNLFSSLQLRICQLSSIPSVEMFSYFTEVLMEGLKKKEEEKSSSVGGNEPTVESNEGNKVQLQELVIDFNKRVEVELIQLKKFKGIEWIQWMFRLHRLGRCCWTNIINLNIKPEEFLSLFPWNEKFRVSREVGGMDPDSSRFSQFECRWFSIREIFCVRFVND